MKSAKKVSWLVWGLAAVLMWVASCDDSSGTASSTCGNGVVEGDEECDGDDLNGGTCEKFGYGGGTLRCTGSCTFDFSECRQIECGNGVVDPGEECDGTLLGNTCESLGYREGKLKCGDDCKFDTSECVPVNCGNGMREGEEQCDGTDFGGATCADFGFEAGELRCTGFCTIDTSQCRHAECGNGVREGTEQCDGTDFGGAACADFGALTGQLTCTEGCAIDTSSCVPDQDLDGIADGEDNCPTVANPGQEDDDGDGVGNDCEPSLDGMYLYMPDRALSSEGTVYGPRIVDDATSQASYMILTFEGGVLHDGTILTELQDEHSHGLIIKRDSQGAIVWTLLLHGDSNDTVTDLALDPEGNIVVAGYTYSNMLWVGQNDSVTGRGIYVLKLDPDGNMIWGKSFHGSGTTVRVWTRGLDVDKDGNIYVAGDFDCNTVTFDATTITRQGHMDGYLVKLSPIGHVQWVRSYSCTVNDASQWVNVSDVACSSNGNVYLYGSGTCLALQFDTGENTLLRGGRALYLAAIEETGSVQWLKSYGRFGASTYSKEMAVDGSGNIYLAGYALGNTNLGGGTLTSHGSYDLFIAKYTQDGNHVWSHLYGGAGGDSVQALGATGDGTLMAIFSTSSTSLSVGGQTFYFQSADLRIGMAMYDADGNHLWSTVLPEPQHRIRGTVHPLPMGFEYVVHSEHNPFTMAGSSGPVRATSLVNSEFLVQGTLDFEGHSSPMEVWEGFSRSYDAIGFLPFHSSSGEYLYGGMWKGPRLQIFGPQATTDHVPSDSWWHLTFFGTRDATSVVGEKNLYGLNEPYFWTTDGTSTIYAIEKLAYPIQCGGNPVDAEYALVKFDLATGTCEWATELGGLPYDENTRMELHQAGLSGGLWMTQDGGVYLLVMFGKDHPIDLGDGAYVPHNNGFAVVKYSANGDVEWSHFYETSAEMDPYDWNNVVHLTIDDQDSIYVVSPYDLPSVMVGNNAFSCQTDTISTFVVKILADGTEQWAIALRVQDNNAGSSGTKPRVFIPDLTVDPNGTLYLVGHFNAQRIDILPANSYHLHNNVLQQRQYDAFLLAVRASNGDILWDVAVEGEERDEVGIRVASDGDIVYMAGSFMSATALLDGTTITNEDPVDNEDLFVAAIGAQDGHLIWADTIGGSGGYTEPIAMAAREGYVYLAGLYDGSTCDVGSVQCSNSDDGGMFLTIINRDGQEVWSSCGGGGDPFLAMIVGRGPSLVVEGGEMLFVWHTLGMAWWEQYSASTGMVEIFAPVMLRVRAELPPR